MSKPSLVGVVLAGAGARGAYEAGALSVLLPVLEAHGRRPRLFVGTSAGALNAVLYASLAHLPAGEAAERALAIWRGAEREDVLRSILVSGVAAAGRYLAQLLGAPVALTSLLAPAPLQHTLETRLDWAQLHRNARHPGVLHGVALATTCCASGRTKIFLEGDGTRPLPPSDEDRAIDYVHARLGPRHVMASAAIPVLFPPVYIAQPGADRGWYLDGGVRLNAPIKPAIDLGADRLLLVATDPIVQMASHYDKPGPAPDVRAALADVLHALLVDRMVEDVRSLGKMNALLTQRAHNPCRLQRPPGRHPYRPLPYVFAGPAQPGELAVLADRVFRRRYGGWRWLRQAPDFPLLHRLLGGAGAINGELLSYFFFEREFMAAAIELGQRDAQRLVDAAQGRLRWETGVAAAV